MPCLAWGGTWTPCLWTRQLGPGFVIILYFVASRWLWGAGQLTTVYPALPLTLPAGGAHFVLSFHSARPFPPTLLPSRPAFQQHCRCFFELTSLQSQHRFRKGVCHPVLQDGWSIFLCCVCTWGSVANLAHARHLSPYEREARLLQPFLVILLGFLALDLRLSFRAPGFLYSVSLMPPLGPKGWAFTVSGHLPHLFLL